MDDKIQIGYIAKTKGYKGEVGLKLKLDDPYILEDVESLFLEFNKKYIPYFIRQLKITPKGFANIFFEEVDGEDAERLVGRAVFLPRTFLENNEESQVVFQDLIGFTVNDSQHGDVGIIDHIIEHPTNILIAVKSDHGEILIPMIDEFIKDIDYKSKTMHVNTPEGLIEINF